MWFCVVLVFCLRGFMLEGLRNGSMSPQSCLPWALSMESHVIKCLSMLTGAVLLSTVQHMSLIFPHTHHIVLMRISSPRIKPYTLNRGFHFIFHALFRLILHYFPRSYTTPLQSLDSPFKEGLLCCLCASSRDLKAVVPTV